MGPLAVGVVTGLDPVIRPGAEVHYALHGGWVTIELRDGVYIILAGRPGAPWERQFRASIRKCTCERIPCLTMTEAHMWRMSDKHAARYCHGFTGLREAIGVKLGPKHEEHVLKIAEGIARTYAPGWRHRPTPLVKPLPPLTAEEKAILAEAAGVRVPEGGEFDGMCPSHWHHTQFCYGVQGGVNHNDND